MSDHSHIQWTDATWTRSNRTAEAWVNAYQAVGTSTKPGTKRRPSRVFSSRNVLKCCALDGPNKVYHRFKNAPTGSLLPLDLGAFQIGYSRRYWGAKSFP